MTESDEDMEILDSDFENENDLEFDKESPITEVEVETTGLRNEQVQYLNELVAHIRSGFRTRKVKATADALSELQSIILELMVDRTKVRKQNTELKK